MMESESINSIKVKSLTDSLGISRSTFYLYYDSVFAVLQDIEDVFFERLQEIESAFWYYPLDDRYLKEPHPVLLKVMHYLKGNSEVSSVLWGPHGDPMFQVRCKKMIRHAFFPESARHLMNPDITELEISFLIGGHLEMNNRWLNHKVEEISEEGMAMLVYRQLADYYRK